MILYIVIFILSCVGFFYCKSEDYYTSIGIMGGFFFGDLFQEKYVKFENTKVWYKCIIRLIGGFTIFFGLNTLLKHVLNHKVKNGKGIPSTLQIYRP